MFSDSDSWRSNASITYVKLKIGDKSKIDKTTKTIVLCYFSDFGRKIFGFWFSLFQVFWVNRARWNRIRQYFCDLKIISMFFGFLKISKNHKGHYRITIQTSLDLMASWKKLQKSEKYRRNVRIAKILSDSVSTYPIYLFHF